MWVPEEKIYIVMMKHGANQFVHGVYRSRAAAKQALELRQVQGSNPPYWYWVEEHIINDR